MDPENEREELTRLRTKHRIVFSGCQLLQMSKPFQTIRRSYGDVKVAIVFFHSTRLLADHAYMEYVSLLTRPFFRQNTKRLWQVPPTEWINGTQKGWETQVAMFARRDFKQTLVVMEGVYYEEELHEQYDRIWRVLDALEQAVAP